ncbi:calmodulin [Pocillopora verrucosa]|uniref:calmodulin n=1 Tax=Pocillopora verrucosa TaxID=203993 RepID=UPI00333EBC9E
MQMVGLNPTDFQIQTLINEVEYDGDGYMTFSDFIKTMEEYKKPDDKVDLMMAFKVFDCNNKGYIETKELRRAFMRLKGITKQELEELLATANLEKDRHVYFEEFSRLLVPLINRDLDIICL